MKRGNGNDGLSPRGRARLCWAMADQTDPDSPATGPAMGMTRINAAAIAFGALAGLGGVTLGAYAAHGAAPEIRPGLETASIYAMIHGLALIAAALVHDRAAGGTGTHRTIAHPTVAQWIITLSMLAFAFGTLFFSGGIFLGAFELYPGTAPLGGILLIAGWLGLVLGALTLLFQGNRR